MSTWLRLSPALLLALGILLTSWMSAALPAHLYLVAPAVLALFVVAASALARRVQAVPRTHLLGALVYALAILAGSALTALKDPALVSDLLPILGASAVVVILDDRSSRACMPPKAT